MNKSWCGLTSYSAPYRQGNFMISVSTAGAFQARPSEAWKYEGVFIVPRKQAAITASQFDP